MELFALYNIIIGSCQIKGKYIMGSRLILVETGLLLLLFTTVLNIVHTDFRKYLSFYMQVRRVLLLLFM